MIFKNKLEEKSKNLLVINIIAKYTYNLLIDMINQIFDNYIKVETKLFI